MKPTLAHPWHLQEYLLSSSSSVSVCSLIVRSEPLIITRVQVKAVEFPGTDSPAVAEPHGGSSSSGVGILR